LWESINAFYLDANRQDPEFFITHGLHDFTTEVGSHCAIIRSRVDDTLLQDQTWVLLKLGSKLYDIDVMTNKGANRALRQYQGTVILKIVEGFDMHRKAYNQLLTPKTMVEFLIGHPYFSRSVTYNMNAVRILLERMDNNSPDRNQVLFQAGKLHNYFHYLEYDDIDEDMGGHLDRALQRVYNLHGAIVDKYFEVS